MSEMAMQQIIISGVGGQGVLFLTKLLAETALRLRYSVLISETHGMAQRGGNVISHLKVGGRGSFSSPLIRPGRADILLALHPDGLLAHGFYLKPGGIVYSNMPQPEKENEVNATSIATQIASPVSANLVFLGFSAASGGLFCKPEQIEKTLAQVAGKRVETNMQAFRAGRNEAEKRG